MFIRNNNENNSNFNNWRLWAALIAMISYLINKIIKSIFSEPIQNDNSKPLQKQKDKRSEKIQAAYAEAKEMHTLGKQGLQLFYQENKPKPAIDHNPKKRIPGETYDAVKNNVITFLNKEGSLWHPNLNANFPLHSFNNYFLICLRYQNINAYREIIGQAYGIKFIFDEITLYRRDTRLPSVIFNDGFKLQEQCNNPNSNKILYAEITTFSYGISFSKIIPPTRYGDANSYYIIYLPPKHDFLLIDIANSPRNQRDITQEQREIEEVNSLDEIPKGFIKTYISKTLFSPQTNDNFAPDIKVSCQERSYRGCY